MNANNIKIFYIYQIFFLGLSVKDYASRKGHSKVVNQLSMQKMSIMARTRSQENVLDDIDQPVEAQVQENDDNSNNQNTSNAQNTELKKEDNIIKSNTDDNHDQIEAIANNSIINDNELEITKLNDQQKHNEIEVVPNNSTIANDNELEIKTINEKQMQNENVILDLKTINAEELDTELIQNKKENIVLDSSLKTEEVYKSSIKPDEVIEKIKLIVEEKNTSINVVSTKDEESVSQCTMPPPMDPPRSWDFIIQTSKKHISDINEKTEKEAQESIEQIPDPIVCSVNTDDSELEWGSDESLPTDPNQSCPVIDDKKEENKKNKKFFNFITTKLLNANKNSRNRVSASADNIIDSISTNKHVRNKSFTSLRTFKLTVPSDVNKALHQLSPEMNFAHSSFSKSKSFNDNIPTENIDKNSLEFERSKSLCLEPKHNSDSAENQQRDSDSQSDDSSLRSKRSLLLSMRMPKVHDEHHDDYYLDVKDCETSEDEGPHYWYSPNKKNVKIVQQDTVIRNNSESEDSE